MYGILDLFGILAGRTLIRVSVIHSLQIYKLLPCIIADYPCKVYAAQDTECLHSNLLRSEDSRCFKIKIEVTSMNISDIRQVNKVWRSTKANDHVVDYGKSSSKLSNRHAKVG